VNLVVSPGRYYGGIFGDNAVPDTLVTPNGLTRIRYFAYGAMFNSKIRFGVASYFADAKTWTNQIFDYVETTPNELNGPRLNGRIKLLTTANAANYFVGQWISIFGLDLQNPFGRLASGPPNNHFQEFKKIIDIDTVTGILTLDGALRWVYL